MTPPDPDIQTVDRWMRQFSEAPLPGAAPANGPLIWWKAQLLARLETERRVTSILDAGWRLAILAAAVAGIGLLAWAWPTIRQSGEGVTGVSLLLGGLLILVPAAAWVLARSDRRADARP